MSVTLLHVLEWPAAILFGYAAGKFARMRGIPAWLAGGGALAAGFLINLICAATAAEREHPWTGLLIWAAWSTFGIVHGWRGERRPSPLTTLNLSGKD
jgi:hypothetical protein